MAQKPGGHMANPLTLDKYGNTLVPNENLKRGELVDRPHMVGTHHMCGGQMTAMPISATHFVLACDGKCGFTMHFPRSTRTIEALRSWCVEHNGAPRQTDAKSAPAAASEA